MSYKGRAVTLMSGDIPVMKYDFTKSEYSVLNAKFMPYGLRGRLNKLPVTRAGMTEDEINSKIQLAQSNANGIRYWFANRTLSLSRSNAKKIYDLLGFEQMDNEYNKYDMSMLCRGISVLDNYWVKFDNEDICWSDVNIRHNHLNEIVAQVALHGDSLTFQGSYATPEISTNGVFAKAWRRHDDGKLWLHKLSFSGGNQSEIEVSVSNVLDKCNVNHVHYEAGSDFGRYVCMCPCISDDNHSVVSAHEYNRYCSMVGLDFIEELLGIDHDGYYKMHIVDYLICNHDRHSHNWGFFVDNSTMNVKSLHPLFDHNNAFENKFLPNARNITNPEYKKMRNKAEFATGEVDFHFTAPILETDFVKPEHYEAFMKHADILGIKTVEPANPFADAVEKMGGN